MTRDEAMKEAFKEAIKIDFNGNSNGLSLLIDKIYDDSEKKIDEIEKKLIYLKGGIEALKDVPNRSREDLAAGRAVLEVVNILIEVLEKR